MMAESYKKIFIISLLFFVGVHCDKEDEKEKELTDVTYDSRSLFINGDRHLLFSGSVHYPRVPVEEWEDVLDKCKEGGLNVIQTYIFWNVHEPIKGQYNFTGQNDIVRFIKLIADRGMWVTLRVGPFVQGEWNNGGYPFWLRKEPNITYRTDNPTFMIENEYDHVRGAFREGAAERYIHWAGNMALSQKTGVPWIMCEQKDAPGEVINACNGRHCGETFEGPNAPNKPPLWTENWTAQSAEDTAFAVARWFSKNGSHTNYYMYHGGTNYGRTAAAFTTTRYYDEAPLDEFANLTVNKCNDQARYYHKNNLCAAFLWNNRTHTPETVKFKGKEHTLPPKSISILPDCKTVVYNTDSDSGSYMERRWTGLKFLEIQGLGTGELDLSSNGWHHTIGLNGEKLEYFTEEGAKKAKWRPAKGNGEFLTWYKTYFDEPEGDDPVAIRMENMTKGVVWVNGKSIGRYWSSFLTIRKAPSQSEYHIPRSYLKPKDNFLVIFDEAGGNIDTVQIETVNRDVVCSYITEDMPPSVMSWKRDAHDAIVTVGDEEPKTKAILKCPKHKVISHVEFASFGNSRGVCGFFLLGTCNSPNTQKIVEQVITP
ncbi:Beta-galactosidase 14 [Bienertia sinuspersici]